jgi:uncharacterized protein
MDADISLLLQEVENYLKKLLSHSLQGLILFGSYARHEADAESDIDLLIILENVGDYLEQYRQIAPILQEIGFRYQKLISICLVSSLVYEQNQTPFYRNIRREGRILI